MVDFKRDKRTGMFSYLWFLDTDVFFGTGNGFLRPSLSLQSHTAVEVQIINIMINASFGSRCISFFYGDAPLTFIISPSLHQLSLRMSKPPTAGRWAGPTSLRHGDRRPPPSPSPRSATGCSRAPWGGITVRRMSCRECWELRRRPPCSRHRLPVLLPTQ